MSFLSILRTVVHDALLVDLAAAPIVSMLNPPIGNAMNIIGQLVLKAETTLPAGTPGPQKKAFVQDAVAQMLPTIQDTPAKKEAVSEMIDTTVAQLNAAHKLQVAEAPKPKP